MTGTDIDRVDMSAIDDDIAKAVLQYIYTDKQPAQLTPLEPVKIFSFRPFIGLRRLDPTRD